MATDSTDNENAGTLEEANKRLREALDLVSPRPAGATSDAWLEKENEMLEFQLALLERNRKLLETEEGRREALYLLQFLQSIPLPTWSANLDARIVHWGGAAAKTYNYKPDRAIGRNFIDLFVVDAEKKQAQDDLVCIIFGQEGAEHFNLCKDKDKNGKQVYLVTCCFPVYDPRSQEMVQAEVSFDLSRLDALEEELEEMYRRHRAEEEDARAIRIARERAVIEEFTRDLFAEVKQYYDRERQILERTIMTNREKIASDKSSKAEKEFHRGQLQTNEGLLRELDAWEADTKSAIARADTLETLEQVRLVVRSKARINV